MPQYTHKGLREGAGRQPEPTGRDALLRSAPTEPEGFVRWGAQRQARGGEVRAFRVVCNMVYASNHRSRVLRNLVGQLDRLLDHDRFDTGISDYAVE